MRAEVGFFEVFIDTDPQFFFTLSFRFQPKIGQVKNKKYWPEILDADKFLFSCSLILPKPCTSRILSSLNYFDSFNDL